MAPRGRRFSPLLVSAAFLAVILAAQCVASSAQAPLISAAASDRNASRSSPRALLNVFRSFLPFPGRLKCRLSANLGANNQHGGGQVGLDGRMDIQVYKFQRQINVLVRIHVENDIIVAPIAQTIRAGTARESGESIWTIDGSWSQSDVDEFDLNKWYEDAENITPVGSSESVYSMVKKISKSWYQREFYARVDTALKPNGAVRGQLHRGWASQWIPFNVC